VLAGVRHETVPAYATHHAARHRTMLRPPILRQSPEHLYMQCVRFPGPKEGGGPVWLPAGDVPEDFVAEVRRAITPRADTPATAA